MGEDLGDESVVPEAGRIRGERWRPVAGFEGLYEVSDLGRVWSVRGVRFLTTGTDRKGYVQVSLWVNGKGCTLRVHRLVLEAFVGPRMPGEECCHGPGGHQDNRLVNIRWDTREANLGRDKLATGTTTRGARNAQTKLTEEQVIDIRARHEAGESQASIARGYGVDSSTVSLIVNRVNWAWLDQPAA